MTMFQIIDSNDIACRFVGERVIHIQCGMLELADSHGWIELSAFAAEDQSWVVTIAIQRCESRFDTHVRMCVSRNIDDLEAFLFDFDVSSILHQSHAAESYYESSATMMLVQLRGMETTRPRQNRIETHGLIHRFRTMMGFENGTDA